MSTQALALMSDYSHVAELETRRKEFQPALRALLTDGNQTAICDKPLSLGLPERVVADSLKTEPIENVMSQPSLGLSTMAWPCDVHLDTRDLCCPKGW
ncbi:unnamed protein product, partial [Protopolystoma xenopodis]